MSRLRLSFCRACGTRRSTSAMAASLQIPPSVSLKPFSCSGPTCDRRRAPSVFKLS